MRTFLLSTALLSFSLLTTGARATTTTFTFTPDGGGAPLTYTFDVSTPTSVLQTTQLDASIYLIGNDRITLIADDEAQWFMTNLHYGHVNFAIVLNNGEDSYLFDGPTLFTGSTTSPHILPGTYHLAGDSGEGYGIGGTLFISGASTPEPSSLALLGTGLAGILGIARRRLATKGR